MPSDSPRHSWPPHRGPRHEQRADADRSADVDQSADLDQAPRYGRHRGEHRPSRVFPVAAAAVSVLGISAAAAGAGWFLFLPDGSGSVASDAHADSTLSRSVPRAEPTPRTTGKTPLSSAVVMPTPTGVLGPAGATHRSASTTGPAQMGPKHRASDGAAGQDPQGSVLARPSPTATRTAPPATASPSPDPTTATPDPAPTTESPSPEPTSDSPSPTPEPTSDSPTPTPTTPTPEPTEDLPLPVPLPDLPLPDIEVKLP